MKRCRSQGQLVLDIRDCQFCRDMFVPRKRSTQAYCSRLCQKRDKKLKPEMIARIQEERRLGKPFKTIAKSLGISVGSAHLYAKEIETPEISKQGAEHILLSPANKRIHIPKRKLLLFCRYFDLDYASIRRSPAINQNVLVSLDF